MVITMDCINKIKNMGYKMVHISNDDPLRYLQEVLFVKNNVAEKFEDIDTEEVLL